jgi:hypothetical protein
VRRSERGQVYQNVKNTLYTDGGFISGIEREVRCTESLRLIIFF